MEEKSEKKVAAAQKKRNKRIKRVRCVGTKEELDKLLQKISEQADKVRQKKAEQGEGEAWRKEAVMREIFTLMELKYDYCCLSPKPITKAELPELFVEVNPPHVIKLRWKVRKPNGKIIRLQKPFVDVTSITGAEVIAVVKEYTHQKNKLPDLNGFVKIEELVTNALGEKTEKKQYRTLLPTDKICLPLKFPGPLLQPEYIVNLRVTFPESSNYLITPPIYKAPKIISKLPQLIDCGINLFDEILKPVATEVVDRGIGAGVTQLVLISVNPKTSEYSIEMAESRQRTLYATVGVHPDDAQQVPIDEIDKIRELAKKGDKFVVAIGECGIDYTRASHSRRSNQNEGLSAEDIEANMQKQEKWLAKQIELAIELKKPLFFHEREAHKRFMQIIEEYKPKGLDTTKCLINCFTGTEEELKVYLSNGFYIGVTGFLCNQARGEELKGLLKQIPLDKIVIGSDAPYLIPFSMGKPFPKFNEPAYLPHVLVLAAECMNVDVSTLAEATTNNCRRLFGLDELPYDGHINNFYEYSPNFKKAVAKVREIKTTEKKDEKKSEDNKNEGETSTGEKKNAAEESKKEDEKEEKEEKKKEEEDETVFVYKNTKYRCTPKEKGILVKQLKLLDDASFADLFKDFELKEIP